MIVQHAYKRHPQQKNSNVRKINFQKTNVCFLLDKNSDYKNANECGFLHALKNFLKIIWKYWYSQQLLFLASKHFVLIKKPPILFVWL